MLIHLRPQADRAAEAAMKREEEAQQRQDAREVRSLYGVIWSPIEILLSKKLVKKRPEVVGLAMKICRLSVG